MSNEERNRVGECGAEQEEKSKWAVALGTVHAEQASSRHLDEIVDLNRTTVEITITCSLQAGFALEAILGEVAHGSGIEARGRRTNRVRAVELEQLASVASDHERQLEDALVEVLNTAADRLTTQAE